MDGSNGSHIEEEPGEQQRLKTASGKDKDYQVTGRQDSSYKSLVFHTSFDKGASIKYVRALGGGGGS